MTATVYSEDDRLNARATFLPLVGTDVEINTSVRDDDIVVRVNKAGILVCRILLENAAREISSERLMDFSTFAPDFVFKVGDTAAGIERLKRSVGLA